MQKNIVINGITVLPGKSAQVNLNIYRLPTRTIIEIPVFVFRSKKPGSVVLFLAGMHGDEINGIEIIRRLLGREDVQHPLCGTVIAIPVINIVSFINGKRELPDGRDLNRCFPGTKGGSLGSRIAYDLMNEIIPQIDVGIDFHTGGSKINNHPQIRCVQRIKTNMDLAKIFSPPLIINSVYRENSLRKEASRKRKTMLVFEGGESARFDYPSINEGMNGCLRVLHHYGMISEGVPKNPVVIIQKSTWVRAKISGLFQTSKVNGAHIRKGEIIGMIGDPFGEVTHKIVAPVTGYLLGINNIPVINQGDALLHIGIE